MKRLRLGMCELQPSLPPVNACDHLDQLSLRRNGSSHLSLAPTIIRYSGTVIHSGTIGAEGTVQVLKGCEGGWLMGCVCALGGLGRL